MTTDAASPQLEPETAGALLRHAREAAGLSLNAVAQQLKLAPRQIEALEDGDFSRLPGRTFVRGFMRNYARLLHLDPEMVLSALPGATPSLEAPALHATAPSIGELPTAEWTKSGRSRWVIPLVLIAIVAGAAVYEYMRPGGDGTRSGAPRTSPPTKTIGEAATTSLPNPLLADTASAGAAMAEPSTPSASTAPATLAASAQPAPASGRASREDAGEGIAQSAAGEATLVLAYRDFSWTEVRDRSGHVLLAKMMTGGQKQTLTGAPPFDVVVGNASDVKVTFRGQPVDLVPLTRGNVARFTLK